MTGQNVGVELLEYWFFAIFHDGQSFRVGNHMLHVDNRYRCLQHKCVEIRVILEQPMQRAKTSASIAHRCTMVKLHARSFVDLIV